MIALSLKETHVKRIKQRAIFAREVVTDQFGHGWVLADCSPPEPAFARAIAGAHHG